MDSLEMHRTEDTITEEGHKVSWILLENPLSTKTNIAEILILAFSPLLTGVSELSLLRMGLSAWGLENLGRH